MCVCVCVCVYVCIQKLFTQCILTHRVCRLYRLVVRPFDCTGL